ncbi:MAG: proton-conducting transporter membrane subunit [Ardenticatenia bacterium]|nr:proton-conducting transporter membrane subunit [Ardenticatenia bacterium]
MTLPPPVWLWIPIWLPLVVAPLVYILRRHELVAAILTAAIFVLSSYLLWTAPPPPTIILGRPVVLERVPRVLLIALGFWMTVGALYAARISQGWSLFPFWLLLFGLLAVAFMFQDFTVRVIVLKVAWLGAILLVQSGVVTSMRAATRLLVVAVLATPALLLAGVLAGRIETTPDLISLAPLAGIGFGIGFSLVLAVVPFHAWLPQVAEDGPPLIAAWFVAALGTAYLVLLIDLVDRMPWLLQEGRGLSLLRSGGLLLIVGGGLLALVETHVGRLWAYSVLVDTGYIVLGIGLGRLIGMETPLLAVGARFVALILSGVALATIRHRAMSLEMNELAGSASRVPLSYLGWLSGGLSFLGVPLSPGFPGHWLILRQLFALDMRLAWGIVVATLLGVVGYVRALNAALRTAPPERLETIEPEPILVTILLLLLLIVASFVGLVPHTIIPLVRFMAQGL